MRICIDSNQFIFGLSGSDVASETLLKLLPRLEVVIPRLVLKEVTRITIVEEPVPADLVRKYVALGLREKADAVIGAFAEWQGAKYIISDNRHFLDELQSSAFEVVSPGEFLQLYYWAAVQEDQ